MAESSVDPAASKDHDWARSDTDLRAAIARVREWLQSVSWDYDKMDEDLYMVCAAAERAADEDARYAELERKHLGDAEKGTGIYAAPPPAAAPADDLAERLRGAAKHGSHGKCSDMCWEAAAAIAALRAERDMAVSTFAYQKGKIERLQADLAAARAALAEICDDMQHARWTHAWGVAREAARAKAAP